MIIALAILIPLQGIQPTTSSDLLKGVPISDRELTVARKHRWILFGKWGESNTGQLRDVAREIVRWRANDKALEAPNGGSSEQSELIRNWKSQLASSPSPLCQFVAKLGNRSFPLESAPSGKWLRITDAGAPGLDTTASSAAITFRATMAKKYDDDGVRVYVLLRRLGDKLDVYAMTFSSNGASLGYDKATARNWSSSEESNLTKSIAAESHSSRLGNGEISTKRSFEPEPGKKLDIDGIIRDGLVGWLQKHFSPYLRSDKPIAILADDYDWLSFLRIGGSLEGFLDRRGYRKIDKDGTWVVVPEFLWNAETCRLREDELSKIDSADGGMETIQKFTHWTVDSGLLVNFDTVAYVESALSWQRSIPDINSQLFPLAPAIAKLGSQSFIKFGTKTNLVGTEAGDLGDSIIWARPDNNFIFGNSRFNETRLGCFWGEGETQRLRSVAFYQGISQRIKMRALGPLGFEPEKLADTLRYFGDNWETILHRAADEEVEVEEGDSVTVSFTSTKGCTLSSELFFPRKSLQKTFFRYLPKDTLDKIKDRTNDFLLQDRNRSTPPPPPPPRAVQ